VLASGAALSSVLYEIVPGFLLGGLACIVVSLAGRAPPEAVVRGFEASDGAFRDATSTRPPANA